MKLLADHTYDCIKELFYDSFGNAVSETRPEVYFPFGFAGGLRDIGTGFVRFGFRDYDPSVGRFTTPDPAKDTRGDGDIYDYCVDDPVNRMDAAGLAFTGSGNHEPVKMEPFKTDEQKGYWRTIPEEGACKKCLEMAKQQFASRPERPHPNCKCEIEFVKLTVSADQVREKHSDSKKYEYEDKGVRVYVIGQRPLDSGLGRWLYDRLEDNENYSETVFNLGFIHEGFISPYTGKTLGFSDGPEGYSIGRDKERLLSSYQLGCVGYNADIIDEAAKIVGAEYLKRHQTYVEMPNKTHRDGVSRKIYDLITSNCQDFVDAVLKTGEKLAHEKNVKFILYEK